MGSLESNIFGKKKFSDILKEIYDNQKKKEAQISALIGELKPLINDIGPIGIWRQYFDESQFKYICQQLDSHNISMNEFILE